MKIISFETETLDGPDDLRIFFDMTDTEYNRLIKMDFYDVYEMFHHCASVCASAKNQEFFYENDELGLSGSVINNTDDYFITPEYSVNMN
jgi:hypothetical protein